MIARIALHGYARTGKDEVGKVLMSKYTFVRRSAGDIIKRQLDPLIMQYFGFSAFTDMDHQKKLIRGLCVEWGYARYDSILQEFMSDLPARCVNTRIFRPAECAAWRAAGGQIVEVRRPGVGPAEPKEAAELDECRRLGFIDCVILNDGTLTDLEAYVDVMVASFGYEETKRHG